MCCVSGFVWFVGYRCDTRPSDGCGATKLKTLASSCSCWQRRWCVCLQVWCSAAGGMALSRTSTLNEERRRSLVSLRTSSIEVNSLSRQLVSTDTTSISLVALFFSLFCLALFVCLFFCICFVCLSLFFLFVFVLFCLFVFVLSVFVLCLRSLTSWIRLWERVRFIHSTATLSHQVETKEIIFLFCLCGKPVQPYKWEKKLHVPNAGSEPLTYWLSSLAALLDHREVGSGLG